MSEILFEYIRRGSYVKVTAIETETRTEASIVVPATLSQEQMQIQVMRKLHYLLKKQEDEL